MRKNPLGRILKMEPKEQHLSTVPKSHFIYIYIYICVGVVTDQGAHTNIHVGPRAQFKEEPLLGQVWPRTKGTTTTESDTPGHSME